MSVSLSDYTLFAPGQGYFTDKVLAKYPEMTGQRLQMEKIDVQANESIRISLPAPPLCAAVLHEDGTAENINGDFFDGIFNAVPHCDGELCIIYAARVPYSLDPMHPRAGEEIINVFFGEFERRFPGECGKGLNFFFSDELEFGINGNLWNDTFAQEFISRKGYDIRPHLFHIFIDDSNVKTRLDYYDVIVALEEENYFSKVYNWHEKRHMTYGCDHGGRGYNVTEFGDYMRTQKYNQGPGCDQPNLSSDIIKNKVASSIAHLHACPRVWLEGFYGSGWGTSTEQLTDAVARNFVMGQNLLSLHGLYYSTHGGYWEWAPPCNCIRMPYWAHMESFLGAVERLSYTLTRGVHTCDIGIIYPVDAVDGGIEGDRAVNAAFELANNLYSHGIDFDFLDRESIVNAEISDDALQISGESYRFIVIPNMRSMRSDCLCKLLTAAKSGVHIVSIGELPTYSDADISPIRKQLAELSDSLADVPPTTEYLTAASRRDVVPMHTKEFYIHHRKADGNDLYMTYGIPQGERCFFRGVGPVVWLNARDGKKYLIENTEHTDGGVIFPMPVESVEFQLFLIGDSDFDEVLNQCETAENNVRTLDNVWNFELAPTMDNTWGDFELPATDGILPCQVKELVCEDRRVRVSYGAYFLAKEDFGSVEAYFKTLDAANCSHTEDFTPYEFSMRYGVENAPGHQGYHGLKGNITDEFLTIGKKVITATSEKFIPYDNGFGKVFFTNIDCDSTVVAEILTGEIEPDDLYVNGVRTEGKTAKLSRGLNRIVAGYRKKEKTGYGRTHLVFAVGAVEKATLPLSMRWFKSKAVLPFDCYGINQPQTFTFMSPPALRSFTARCEGVITSVRIGNEEAELTHDNNTFTAAIKKVSALPCQVSITVENTHGCYGGAVFSEPIKLDCEKGRMPVGDWSQIDGLKFYSGGAVYSQIVSVDEYTDTKNAVLSVDRIVSTARAIVNGHDCGVRFAPPWQWNIGSSLREGENEIRLEVCNTIGNHYEYLPTRYKSGTESGLIGDARIIFSK